MEIPKSTKKKQPSPSGFGFFYLEISRLMEFLKTVRKMLSEYLRFRWRLEWDERLESMNTQWEDSRNIIEWSAKWIEMDRAICRHASRCCLAYQNILTLLKVSLMPSGASKSSSLITWLVFRLMPVRWIKTNEPWMEESIKYRVTIEHELRRYVVDADTFAQRYAINITRWTQPQRLWLKNDVHRDVKPQTERNRDEFGCGEFLAEYF